MPDFTAKDVQSLRQSTGAGMMDAKKALTESGGDMEAAVQILREKGLAKAAGRGDRENAEGTISVASNGSVAAMVQLKSETDFSSKSDAFQAFAQKLADAVLADGEDAIAAHQDEIDQLKLTTKENIEVGTVARFDAAEGNVLDAYLHGGGRVGVLVEGAGTDADTVHEIAMHIAFAKPDFVERSAVPDAEVDKERASLLEITKAEGKPEPAWEKIVEGRLSAWYGERVLVEQGLFGDKEKVKDKLGDGSIVRFALAQIGS